MRVKIPDRTCVLITRECAIITLRYISCERATMTQCLGKTVEHASLQFTAEDRQ